MRRGNFCLLPFGDFSSRPAEEQPLLLLPLPSWLGKQRPSASPALQTENHPKNLSEKGLLSWKLEEFVGSNHQIASTASGPTAPQEGAQSGSGIPLPTLEPISPCRDTDPLYNLTPESL